MTAYTDLADIPRGKYRTVLLDPPWTWKTYSEKGLDGRPQHYARMTDKEIAALPVRELLDPTGAWVFLWSTSPKMPFALTLADAWGLEFSGRAFVWIKINRDGRPFSGMGYTTRKNAEDVFLFRIGKPERVARDVAEVVLAPRRDHSQKPDEVLHRIERFCPGPRLEMFARSRRPGWDQFGNEIEKFAVQHASL